MRSCLVSVCALPKSIRTCLPDVNSPLGIPPGIPQVPHTRRDALLKPACLQASAIPPPGPATPFPPAALPHQKLSPQQPSPVRLSTRRSPITDHRVGDKRTNISKSGHFRRRIDEHRTACDRRTEKNDRGAASTP